MQNYCYILVDKGTEEIIIGHESRYIIKSEQ